MFKQTILLLAMGLSVTTSFADEYKITATSTATAKAAISKAPMTDAEKEKIALQIVDSCASLMSYGWLMMSERQSGKSKAELLKTAREYKLKTYGGLGKREMMVNEAFKKPLGKTANQREYQSDLFLADTWNACQDIEAKKHGVNLPPISPPSPKN